MFDVLVVGGGPVGACLGALLARAAAGARGLSVAVLEPRPPAPLPADAALEARVVALSRASEHLLRSAGAWQGITGPRLSAYERMRIWHESVAPDSEAVLVFDAADVATSSRIACCRARYSRRLRRLADASSVRRSARSRSPTSA